MHSQHACSSSRLHTMQCKHRSVPFNQPTLPFSNQVLDKIGAACLLSLKYLPLYSSLIYIIGNLTLLSFYDYVPLCGGSLKTIV